MVNKKKNQIYIKMTRVLNNMIKVFHWVENFLLIYEPIVEILKSELPLLIEILIQYLG